MGDAAFGSRPGLKPQRGVLGLVKGLKFAFLIARQPTVNIESKTGQRAWRTKEETRDSSLSGTHLDVGALRVDQLHDDFAQLLGVGQLTRRC